MIEYIILVGVIAAIAIGVVRVFGPGVKATFDREGDSIASVDARDGSEEGSSESSTSSRSSQASTSSGIKAEPGSSDAETRDATLASETRGSTLASETAGSTPASEDEAADTGSPWRVVFIAIGVAAAVLLLLSVVRAKNRSSD